MQRAICPKVDLESGTVGSVRRQHTRDNAGDYIVVFRLFTAQALKIFGTLLSYTSVTVQTQPTAPAEWLNSDKTKWFKNVFALQIDF